MLRSVVLAAGASSRMGRPKPALPADSRGDTFLARIVRTLLEAGLPEIVVVSGADAAAVRAAWPGWDRRVRIVRNDQWETGQLSSLLAGLDAPSAAPIEGMLVTLVDVPLVTSTTVRSLVRVWRETRAPVVRPARLSAGAGHEEHGHPAIFDSSIFAELRAADPSTGAKPVVRAHADAVQNVPIDDPGAYLDIDTPEDYRRLRITR